MKPLSSPVATCCSRRSASAPDTSADMIWPPAKPISMRTVVSGIGHQLAEYAAERVRVEERDLEAEQARTRLVVDELRPVRSEGFELGPQVVDLERDVVHPRAAPREEPSDGRVVAERPEQLDP